LDIVYDEYYEGGTKDFFPFLSKAMTKNPDLFLNLASPPPDWALRIKQARQLGFEGKFLECHPIEVATMAPIAGAENLEGIMGYDYVMDGPGSNEKTQAFKKTYMEKHGKWDPFSILVGAPLSALLMAYEKAGSLDSDKVISVITEDARWDTFTGLSGSFGGISRYGRAAQWLSPQYMQIVIDGKPVPQLEDGEISIDDMLHGWD
jgi:branched-chain amino acid transport system substrate-binding protein